MLHGNDLLKSSKINAFYCVIQLFIHVLYLIVLDH